MARSLRPPSVKNSHDSPSIQPTKLSRFSSCPDTLLSADRVIFADATVSTRSRSSKKCRRRRADVSSWPLADMTARDSDVRFRDAGSTGRCNTGVKSLGWGFKLQGLAWSFVELARDFVQIGLRVHRQVRRRPPPSPSLDVPLTVMTAHTFQSAHP